MARHYIRSSCCGASVVGMVDITVHPRIYVEDGVGKAGPIGDTMAAVRWAAEHGSVDLAECYCEECGQAVEVPGA